jgi:hypothetical protein
MSWLASIELLAGVAAIVIWWPALRLVGHRDKPLTNTRFVVLPSLFLLWIVGGFMLIARGVGLL